LKSISIPDAALDNPSYLTRSISIFMTGQLDVNHPFENCLLLEEIAQSFNMSIRDYLRYQNRLRRERISRRMTVLLFLNRINAERIRRGEEEVERRNLISDEGSCGTIGGEISGSADGSNEINDGTLEGVNPAGLMISDINEIELLRRENARQVEEIAALRREVGALRENNENTVERSNLHLDGVLAEDMIHIENVWKYEIVMFLFLREG